VEERATGAAIRAALRELARGSPDDTVMLFFSGHGARVPGAAPHQYLLPYDGQLDALESTAIGSAELTELLRAIPAQRLLVLLDCCYSGGVADPKGAAPGLQAGLDDETYARLAQGAGRVVIASSRPDEQSWTVRNMRNGLFTHYLLAALRGEGHLLGDGYVRVFDLFRHIAVGVPEHAARVGVEQHPIFKASAMELDFPVALA
jgi:uncharacterized caspase-like protein